MTRWTSAMGRGRRDAQQFFFWQFEAPRWMQTTWSALAILRKTFDLLIRVCLPLLCERQRGRCCCWCGKTRIFSAGLQLSEACQGTSCDERLGRRGGTSLRSSLPGRTRVEKKNERKKKNRWQRHLPWSLCLMLRNTLPPLWLKKKTRCCCCCRNKSMTWCQTGGWHRNTQEKLSSKVFLQAPSSAIPARQHGKVPLWLYALWVLGIMGYIGESTVSDEFKRLPPKRQKNPNDKTQPTFGPGRPSPIGPLSPWTPCGPWGPWTKSNMKEMSSLPIKKTSITVVISLITAWQL